MIGSAVQSQGTYRQTTSRTHIHIYGQFGAFNYLDMFLESDLGAMQRKAMRVQIEQDGLSPEPF